MALQYKEENFKHTINANTSILENNPKQKKLIPLLDKEWYKLITSIRIMDSFTAGIMLEEMYQYIPMLFGIPKKVLSNNEFEDKVMILNPEWIDCKDWIDFHAGWVIDYKTNAVTHHPVRRLQEKFCFNEEFWGGK